MLQFTSVDIKQKKNETLNVISKRRNTSVTVFAYCFQFIDILFDFHPNLARFA